MEKKYLVGIAGGSGAGKSTIIRMLLEKCPDLDISIFYQDHYYLDLSHLPAEERRQQNFDHPDAFDRNLMFQHLEMLLSGQEIASPLYDYATHSRTLDSIAVKPSRIIIFDGLLCLQDENLRKLFDLKLYVDVPDDIRLIRRIRRDVIERGRTIDSVMSQYMETVRPMHYQFVEPSKHEADMVIDWEKRRHLALDAVSRILKSISIN